ncbi:MAG: hypothetical protein LBD20_04460 [Spirochaetaceae bacterium]|nr:hypothetical protein [Spirochaetaceae bacterium]
MNRKNFKVVALHQEKREDEVVEESVLNFKYLEEIRKAGIAFYKAGAKDKDSERFTKVERNIYGYRKWTEE